MNDAASGNEIAVIGMNGRFPGAAGVDDLWRNLCAGVDAAVALSDDELRAAGVPAEQAADPAYVRLAQVVDGEDLFDAAFFDYSAHEAELIDPQQRLFLECAWELLELAGYDPRRAPGRVGVVASAGHSGYAEAALSSGDPAGGFGARISIDKDFVATRVGYKLNLKGPCLTVQTACSSSLVAIHVACQSLLNGEADMVIAGGASVRIPQRTGYRHQEGFILSPDGRCRAFDAEAQGCNAGGGVAVVLLKRLEDALADGDEIHAVIRGSAINNDGSAKAGYTAPSVDGQAEVIAEALTVAGVHPASIGFVEAHGTGTRLGDPIEVAALTQVFRAYTGEREFCALGSIKTNVGHLDAAAGAAGLIKAALAVKHGQIPPSLHFSRPNPEIGLDASPFFVNTGLEPWKSGKPRRAGVSSFGIGGTNAHAVLEQPPPRPPSGPSRRPLQVLALSARTESALQEQTGRLARYLAGTPAQDVADIADIAYTLQTGRHRFAHRRVLVCRDLADAAAALEAVDPERLASAVEDASGVPVAFMFPGGGAQYPGMAREIYETEPLFREDVDRCAELLRSESGFELLPLLFPPQERIEEVAREMQRTSLALPALFAVEYALARLWMSWGVRPHAMIGHSLGEYTAACLAGVFSLEDALRLVTLRSRLFEALPPGTMLSVPMPEAELLPLLGDDLSVAAVNGPGMSVASGSVEAVETLAARLSAQGIDCRRLHIDVAAHSKLVSPILAEFGAFVETLALQPPRIPFLSNVTGTWARGEDVTDPSYWTRHLRHTVRFGDGLAQLLKTERQILLEVGPGRTLTNFALALPGRSPSTVALTSLRHPRDPQSDLVVLLSTLGRLWLWGVDVDWQGFHAGERRLRVPLPTYPFERRKYLLAPRRAERSRCVQEQDLAHWFHLPSWKPSLPPASSVDGPRRHLLFLDRGGLGVELARLLGEQGHEVVTAQAGERFARPGERSFTLCPEEREDWERLLASLADEGLTPERIVHLGAVSPQGAARADFQSLIALAQALASVGAGFDLTVVTSGLQDVSGDEDIQPGKAMLLAPCRTIPQELPSVRCRSIDMAAPEPGSSAARRMAGQVAAELSGDASVVAYRGARRWLPGFEPAAVPAGRASRLRRGGTYLLLGVGRVGLSLARHLAASVQPRLVLVSRNGLPPADADGLESLGAEVEVVRADVADPEALRRVVADVLARRGRIDGVVHAAGLTGKPAFTSLDGLTRELCEEQLRPKVEGLLALEKALDGADLDFCVLISCLSSVLGGVGATAYAAGHLFLEAFARRCNGRFGRPWTALTWDGWPAEAGQAFERALSAGPVAHLLVSAVDLEARLEQWQAVQSGGDAAEAAPPALHSRPKLSSVFVEPRNPVEAGVAGIFEGLLGIRPVGIYDNFFEMGGNSLIATQALSRLRDTFQTLPPLSVLFEAPTVAGLAQMIAAVGVAKGAGLPAEAAIEMEVGEI